jgi:hypothetical protein
MAPLRRRSYRRRSDQIKPQRHGVTEMLRARVERRSIRRRVVPLGGSCLRGLFLVRAAGSTEHVESVACLVKAGSGGTNTHPSTIGRTRALSGVETSHSGRALRGAQVAQCSNSVAAPAGYPGHSRMPASLSLVSTARPRCSNEPPLDAFHGTEDTARAGVRNWFAATSARSRSAAASFRWCSRPTVCFSR